MSAIKKVLTAIAGFFIKLWRNFKEFIRKKIVSLKRDTKIIPLIMMFCVFLYYSLNLTDVSDTTALIQGRGMGLCQFIIMLLSMLSLVCLMNSYPRRKKVNIPMLVLTFVMLGIIAYCDIHYVDKIVAALNRAESPIVISEKNKNLFVQEAYYMLNTHVILVGVSAALVALVPVMKKLLGLIKTSVEVEDNGNMAEIELSE